MTTTSEHSAPSSHVWTVVLAAGDGVRMRRLTQALHGCAIPKQYAAIQGNRSLLQATLSRTSAWSEPDHIVVVVAEGYEDIARTQLAPFGDIEIVVQPQNRGTAPGVLLPIAHVLRRDPAATVVVTPCDHYFRDEELLSHTVERAEAVARSGGPIVLVGAVPGYAETQYGWIVAEGNRVKRFIEKPTAEVARRLFETGALWNTFLMVGPAARFWELGRRRLPRATALLEKYRRAIGRPGARELLTEIYAEMQSADFCRDILEKADSLHVARLPQCGWSDWGTPERVLESLAGTPEHARLVESLRPEAQSGAPFEAAS
jgi:mannose-1-phosphate guanylyltransferase